MPNIKQMKFFCREFGRGEIACYEIPNDTNPQFLSLRSRLNPELEYYAILDDTEHKLDEVMSLLSAKNGDDVAEALIEEGCITRI